MCQCLELKLIHEKYFLIFFIKGFCFHSQPGNSDSYNVTVKPETKKKTKKAELDDLKKEIEFVSNARYVFSRV